MSDIAVPAQAGGEVQTIYESHGADGLANPITDSARSPGARGEVQVQCESHMNSGLANPIGDGSPPPDASGEVQNSNESQTSRGLSAAPPELTAIIAHLAELQVRRKFCIKLATKQTNAAGALVRRYLGHDSNNKDQDEKTREAMKTRAAKIVAYAFGGKPQSEENKEILERVAIDLGVVANCLSPLKKNRDGIEKEMRKLAKQLPVYAFAESVSGFGDLGLAVVIGEAGDLGKYPHERMLWKRLGFAPFDGRAMSQWRVKGGLSAEQWVAAGYSPSRRAEVHSCISDPLFRRQTVCAGKYRMVYDVRRAKMLAQYPDRSKAHLHNDALRIMTKELLADLWRVWRAGKSVEPRSQEERIMPWI